MKDNYLFTSNLETNSRFVEEQAELLKRMKRAIALNCVDCSGPSKECIAKDSSQCRLYFFSPYYNREIITCVTEGCENPVQIMEYCLSCYKKLKKICPK